MAHGAEGRVPFLDSAIAEVAYLLPDRLKINKGKGKWLLRRWLQINLPVVRPMQAKRGFTVPVGGWIENRAEKLGPLVAAKDVFTAAAQREISDVLSDTFVDWASRSAPRPVRRPSGKSWC